MSAGFIRWCFQKSAPRFLTVRLAATLRQGPPIRGLGSGRLQESGTERGSRTSLGPAERFAQAAGLRPFHPRGPRRSTHPAFYQICCSSGGRRLRLRICTRAPGMTVINFIRGTRSTSGTCTNRCCARVFHRGCDLNEASCRRRKFHKSMKPRIVQRISVVIRMQPNSGHVVFVSASAQVIFPVRQFRIDRAHRNQLRPTATCVRQPLIHSGDIAMQNPFETSRPRLSDSRDSQFLHKGVRIVERQSPKRPAEEADVGIDDPETRLFVVS